MSELSPRKQLIIGVSLSLITVFLSATVAAVGKHLSGEVHVAAIVMAQYSLSFVFALPPVIRGGRQSLRTSRPMLHLLRGISGCACFYSYYFALRHTSLMEATLLRNTAPLMVPLIIFVFLGQKVQRVAWPPLLIGFLGVVLVLRPGFESFTVWHLTALFSGLGLAVSMVTTRLLVLEEPQSRILFYYFAIAFVLTLPFFLGSDQAIPVSAWPWLLYMGVMMYVCFVLYTQAYRFVSPSALAPTSYFAVVFGGAIDWLVWDQVPAPLTLMGIGLVVFGGVLVVRRQQP